MKIALVTDSTADLPENLAEKYNINVIRNLIYIAGQSYEDGRGITREEFYNRLPMMKETPTTGTAASGVYTELYEQLFAAGADAILSIHASALLSGILNAANSAAHEYGERVIVQDSESVSMGLGFQVLAAAKAIASGSSLAEVLALLADIRQRVRVVAMLDTLEYVRRSGRVSWAKARIGNLLQVKPFLQVRDGGKVVSLGDARTRSKGIQRLVELTLSQGPLEQLAILHANAEGDARRVLDELKLKLSDEPLIISITSVIGAHVGPNCLGFAAVVK